MIAPGPGGARDLRVGAVPGTYVVVPNWNGAAHLGPCIRSLAAQDDDDFAIVVVDNGSADDSVAVLDALAAEIAPVRLTVLRNDVNLGFAGGVNRGIRHAIDAGATAVALFNNDAVADARMVGDTRRGARVRPRRRDRHRTSADGRRADGRQHRRLLLRVGPGVPP